MSMGGMIVPFQVSHPPDEDHVLEVTVVQIRSGSRDN